MDHFFFFFFYLLLSAQSQSKYAKDTTMRPLWKKMGGEEKQQVAVCGLVCSCASVCISTICET